METITHLKHFDAHRVKIFIKSFVGTKEKKESSKKVQVLQKQFFKKFEIVLFSTGIYEG